MNTHPIRLTLKQRAYLRKIHKWLNSLDKLYVGSTLKYEAKNGKTVVVQIDSTSSKLEYILNEGAYGYHQITFLNNLKWLYYELEELQKDTLNWQFL